MFLAIHFILLANLILLNFKYIRLVNFLLADSIHFKNLANLIIQYINPHLIANLSLITMIIVQHLSTPAHRSIKLLEMDSPLFIRLLLGLLTQVKFIITTPTIILFIQIISLQLLPINTPHYLLIHIIIID